VAAGNTMMSPPERHNKATIISMAVIASPISALLHEGVGHGLVAWLRGDVPTQLTSNHLTSLHPDRWVDAGGTLVNLFAGAVCLLLARAIGGRANTRYFLWLLAAFNLLPGAGYFMFSGITGFGDWQEFIRGLPHQAALRITMTIFGAALYLAMTRLLARAVKPFCPNRDVYNTAGRLPYYAHCLFSCAASAFDPLGLKLLLVSSVPAAFGGSSGLLWADSLMPRAAEQGPLRISRQPVWWIAAAVFGLAYIVIIGRGIQFTH
jgi:hypothetical protein